MRSQSMLIACFFIAGLASVSGCGSGGSSAYIPSGDKGTVSGKVLLNDKPVPAGTSVQFTHTKVAVPAVSTVAADGSYSLEMIDTLQIPIGLYRITVQPPAQRAMSEAEYEAFMAKGTDGREQSVDASTAIPSQYLRIETTPLKYEVKAGENTYDIKLTN